MLRRGRQAAQVCQQGVAVTDVLLVPGCRCGGRLLQEIRQAVDLRGTQLWRKRRHLTGRAPLLDDLAHFVRLDPPQACRQQRRAAGANAVEAMAACAVTLVVLGRRTVCGGGPEQGHQQQAFHTATASRAGDRLAGKCRGAPANRFTTWPITVRVGTPGSQSAAIVGNWRRVPRATYWSARAPLLISAAGVSAGRPAATRCSAISARFDRPI